jgi:cell division protein FtsB
VSASSSLGTHDDADDSVGGTSMLRSSLLIGIPVALILVVAASVLLGGDGVVKRYRLRTDLDLAQAELAEIQRENQRMQRELRLMDEDPRMIERRAAEVLSWGAPGATLYRFESGIEER